MCRYELLDLMCDRFGLPRTRMSYTIFARLRWTFGQKCIREDGKVFWCTDSKYPFGVSKHRRDVLRIHGHERDLVTQCPHSLCCEAILFATVSGFAETGLSTAGGVIRSDEATFVLGRWFVPHPTTATARDKEHRPLCPGACNINHCLWTYAKTDRRRKSLFVTKTTRSQTFNSQRHLFGKNVGDQNSKCDLDAKAYYCFLDVENISHVMYMSPQFIDSSDTHDYKTWLQTVTVV